MEQFASFAKTLPNNRKISVMVPLNFAVGTYEQSCGRCSRETIGDPIGRTCITTLTGALERGTGWMHLECAQITCEAWAFAELRDKDIVTVNGTQKELLAAISGTNGTSCVIVDFDYKRGREKRYVWSVVRNKNTRQTAIDSWREGDV